MIKLLASLLLFPVVVLAGFTEPDRALIGNRNLLTNPGFENGKAGWSASAGTFTINTSAANIGSGNAAGSWATGASSRTLSSTAVTIPAGSFAKSGVASCNIKGSTAAHTISVYDGSATLASTTVTLGSTYVRTSINFVMPSSGTVAVRITSASSETIYVDDCYLGLANGFNVSQTNQAVLFGTLNYAQTSNCLWTRNNVAFGSFSADTDCPAPTVTGQASAPSTKIPAITFSNMGPGEYLFIFTGEFYQGSAANTAHFRCHDGTSASDEMHVVYDNAAYQNTITCRFSYTTAGTRTIELQAKTNGSVNMSIDASATANFNVKVYKFPSSADTVYSPDKVANSWSGYHDNDCSWARTNVALGDPAADASCTLTERTNTNFGTVTSYLSGSDKLPGIVFTPSRAGKYEVCATFSGEASGTGVGVGIRLWDGTTVINDVGFQTTTTNAENGKDKTRCGFLNVTSTSAVTVSLQVAASSGSYTITGGYGVNTSRAIEWTIKQIDSQFPAPLLVNSVVSYATSPERVVRAKISAAGVVSLESGDWINGNCATSGGGNNFYTCTLNSNIFSSTPVCVAGITTATGNHGEIILSTVSTSSIVAETYSSGGADSDRDWSLICMGPR